MKQIPNTIKTAMALLILAILTAGHSQALAQQTDPFDEGLQMYYKKQFRDSEEFFMDALNKDPMDALSLSFYLSARYHSNELIKAVNLLEKRSIDGGETPVLKAHLAIGYFTRGLLDPNMMDEARTQLKDALTANPDLSVANTAMGMIYYQKRLIPRAKGYFIKALQSNPKDIMALERTGEILMVDDKNPSKALDFFNQIIALRPNYSDGYFYAASAQQKMGNTEEAARLFEKCMELDPLGVLKGYDAPIRLGDMCLNDKRWEDAEKYYNKALAINPDNPYAKTQLKKAKAKGQKWEGEKDNNVKKKLELEL